MDPEKTQKMERVTPMRSIPLVCSWCKKIYRIERHIYADNKRTSPSHGICPECLENLKNQMDNKEEK